MIHQNIVFIVLTVLFFLINVRIRNTYVGKQFYQGNFEYFIISCKIRISTKCRFRFSPDLRGPKFARTFFSSHFLQLVFFKFLFGKIVFIFTVAMFALWISRKKTCRFHGNLGFPGKLQVRFFLWQSRFDQISAQNRVCKLMVGPAASYDETLSKTEAIIR